MTKKERFPHSKFMKLNPQPGLYIDKKKDLLFTKEYTEKSIS
jgi:hypothetical protein